MLDLFLIALLGFLGSFGHCVGMCGPITVAFALASQQSEPQSVSPPWQQQLLFHGLLNLGRLLSYALVGGSIGAVGSVLIASGQMAGVGSLLRQGLAMVTGILLIWFGLVQINPESLPRLPLLNPLGGNRLHHRLNAAMTRLSVRSHWWTPALLGGVWGLIPCGFLYAAQIKAAETGNLWRGAAVMGAFGLGTVPSMLGVGLTTAKLSADRRSQLFRLGGWITLSIGVLTLLRTDAMVDVTGHGAIILLMIALAARPLSRFWPQPLQYRRVFGTGAYILALAHTGRMLDHTLQWRVEAIAFMLPQHRIGMEMGIAALVLLTPAALTSFDWLQQKLGDRWRHIHLLTIPAFVLAAGHTVLIGSHYLGGFNGSWQNQLWTGGLIAIALMVLLMRIRLFWRLLSLEQFYSSSIKSK
jgi:uncharacterized protein